MKTRLTIAAVLTLTSAVVWFSFRRSGENPAVPVDAAALHEGTLTTQSDAAEVFKRALWRRPAPTDKILQAERREWTKNTAPGTTHWQWFLAVEPGPALTKWLREQNPFSLYPDKTGAAPDVKCAPAWFPGDLAPYEVHIGGNGGDLVFLFSRAGNTLYATGSGNGFTAGAPEPPATAAAPIAASAGRLPLTPPPTPRTP